MSADRGTGKQTEAGSVPWSTLDDIAADIAARWDALLTKLDHWDLDEIPHGTIPHWRDIAACQFTYHPCFFPETGHKKHVEQARGWCGHCPVTVECLAYAIRHDVREGVWGGKTYHQRRRKR